VAGPVAALGRRLQFLAKLAALTPRPAINLLLYHGVLAPHARWRPQVVGYGRPAPEAAADDSAEPARLPPPPPPNWTWAALLQREELLEVGRTGRVVGGRQGLRACRVLAAIGASCWVARPELLRERQGEELVGSPPQIVHESVRHPVPSGGEEADLLAGRVDLPSHVLTIRSTTGAG